MGKRLEFKKLKSGKWYCKELDIFFNTKEETLKFGEKIAGYMFLMILLPNINSFLIIYSPNSKLLFSPQQMEVLLMKTVQQ